MKSVINRLGWQMLVISSSHKFKTLCRKLAHPNKYTEKSFTNPIDIGRLTLGRLSSTCILSIIPLLVNRFLPKTQLLLQLKLSSLQTAWHWIRLYTMGLLTKVHPSDWLIEICVSEFYPSKVCSSVQVIIISVDMIIKRSLYMLNDLIDF